MKAVMLHEAGDIRLETLDDPICPDGGVVISVSACGVCAADLKMARDGHRALSLPRILGHEIVGRITESRHSALPAGQRVSVAPGMGCGHCRWCQAGMEHRCRDVDIFGFTKDGGFCERMAVPMTGRHSATLLDIPDRVSDALGTLTEPLACCVNAQSRLAIGPEDAVLIIGAGPLGLLHALLAGEAPPRATVISDPSPVRREMAGRFPVDAVVDPSDPEWPMAVHQATGGGVDVMILAAPGVVPAPPLTEVLNRGARVSLFSGMPPSPPTDMWDWNAAHYNEWTLSGAYGCSARHCAEAIRLMEARAAEFAPIISRRCPMAALPGLLGAGRNDNELKTIMEVK